MTGAWGTSMTARLPRTLLALACLFLAFCHGPAQGGTTEPMILAVHPYLPTEEILARFKPLADYLALEMGRPVSVRVGRDYKEHSQAIGANRVDIAFMGPAPYVRMVSRFGRKPLLARFEVNGQPKLYGVIATRQDSSLQELRALAGKRFAFGDPESTMSHTVPRHLLMEAGIARGLPAHYRFLGSHMNVALGVLVGDFDAGAMKKEVFDEFAPKGLRALAVTPGMPDHLFVARSDLPPADIVRLRQALLRLGGKANGPAILEKLHQKLTALVPAADGDYDALRDMVMAVDAADC